MSKKMKNLTRLLAIVLSVLFVLQIMPNETLAAEVTAKAAEQAYTDNLLSTPVGEEEEEEEKAAIVSEITEKRDEYTKVYKRADGSYTTLLSKVPLHFENDGAWVNVDNTLQSKGNAYENASGAFDISFPKVITQEHPIQIVKGEKSISFSLNDIALSNASVENNIAALPSEEQQIQDDMAPAAASVTYEEIAANTDLEYVVTASYVKENIIVGNPASVQNSYSFTVNKGNLSAVKEDNGSIQFRDSAGKVPFTIPAPVMTDGGNAVSYDIGVAVSEKSSTEITVVYTPSAEWLQNPEREYPVVIDPVISVTSDKAGLVEDTLICASSATPSQNTTNFYSTCLGVVSNSEYEDENGNPAYLRGDVLAKLNMDTYKALQKPGVVVTNAQFVARGTCYGGNLLLKPVSNSWVADEITYEDVYPSIPDPATNELPAPLVSYENRVVDYYTGTATNDSESDEDFIHFNFTPLFNEWLSGTRANNGFAIVADGSDATGILVLGGTNVNQNGSTTAFSTYCLVDYTDASGYNGNYEYHTQEIGRAGTAYINKFTRALSLSRGDLSLPGNVMPVSLSFHFNNAFDNFWQGYAAFLNNSGIMEGTLTLSNHCGNKWTSNYGRMLCSLSETQYMYYSGDGSLVTFNQKTVPVQEASAGDTGTQTDSIVFEEDKEGYSGYTLEVIDQTEEIGTENLKITNPNGETELFDESGYLTVIRESEAKADGSYDEIHISYTLLDEDLGLPDISSITDGVGRRYDFQYDSATKLLTSVVCRTAAGSVITAGSTTEPEAVSFAYDTAGNLTTVTYPDGKSVTYTYDSNGNMVSAKNIDNYKVNYTYDTLGKVKSIKEYGYNGSYYVAGNTVAASNISSHQTKFIDGSTGTEIYQFDSNGDLLYTFDENGNFKKATSTDTIGTIAGNEWTPLSANLLQNASFETGRNIINSDAKNWSGSFSRIAPGTVSASATAHSGSYVCRLNSDTAVFKWQTQDVAVSGSDTYCVSLFIKPLAAGSMKIKLDLECSDGTIKTFYQVVSVAESDMQNANWTQYYVSGTVENKTIESANVSLGFDGMQGDFLVDDVQLQKGDCSAAFNLIEDNLFQNIDSSDWSGSNYSQEDSALCGNNVTALKLNGALPYYAADAGEAALSLHDSISSVTKAIAVNGAKNDVFSIGGWLKCYVADNSIATNVLAALFPDGTPTFRNNRIAQIKVDYNYVEETDGVTQTKTDSFAVNFQKGVSDWQFAIDSFTLKGATSVVHVTLLYKNNPGDALFTGLRLEKEENTENDISDSVAEIPSCSICGCIGCTMGENCNCSHTNDADYNGECDCRECRGCLCENCEEDDCACRCLSEETCTCAQCHRRSNNETKNADGTVKTVSSFDGVKYMQASETYSSDNNYTTAVTDSNNIASGYAYNVNNGTQLSTTDGMNQVASYTSNAMGYLTLAEMNASELANSAEKIAIGFEYANEKLTNISAGNVLYDYAYDAFGQITSISVDNNILVNYTYFEGTNRTRVHTINAGDFNLRYYYNSLGNIWRIEKYVVVDNEPVSVNYYFSYSTAGDLKKIIDSETDRTLEYTENGVKITATQNGAVIYESGVNDNGEAVEAMNGITLTAKSYDSSYDQASGETTGKSAVTTGTKTLGTVTVSDYFGRTKSSSVMTKDPTDTAATGYAEIASAYQYSSYGTDKTTGLVSQVENTITGTAGTSAVNYSYSYDANGRLHTANGVTYSYDEAGQLKTVTYSGGSESYTYDRNGNITAKTVTTSSQALGTQTVTDTFGYGSTSWEDRLTSFNNQSISYDAIGNPLSYLGATLHWRGRELTSYSKGNKQISYNYDVDGMRYKKTVTTNGTVTDVYDYVYSDGKLIAVKHTAGSATNSARFIYDEGGAVKGFIFNDTAVYLYLKNLQGDITALVDESGSVMLTYTYDAFGGISFAGTNGGLTGVALSLSKVNPFTYRGYCYDDDIGMYYLQSRYYDPEICRFINADSTDYLGASGGMVSYNLFAYCENDPVNGVDPKGCKIVANINKYVGVSDYLSKYRYSLTSFNCYGYAFGQFTLINPGFASNSILKVGSNVSAVFKLVAKDAGILYRNATNVTNRGGANYVVKGHTWLMALRIGCRMINGRRVWDYHFMKKNAKDLWSFKAGKAGPVIELRGKYNPNTITWDMYRKEGKKWCVSFRGFYTSDIIYILITDK